MNLEDEDDRGFEIRLPVPVKHFFREEQYGVKAAAAFLAAREWPDEELVELARSRASVRREFVGLMRNCMWFIRNHRSVAPESVLTAVRHYAATEATLELAGVHPLLLTLVCDFLLCECNCNGACMSLDCDLLDVSTMPRALCDHVRLRAREIVDADEMSCVMIVKRLRVAGRHSARQA